MVNLVLVSHSYTLACGIAQLAEQMNHGCRIALAAGMAEPENAIGTDAVRIMHAIEQVYSPDGVLILMDLGSALLSAETALELIDPAMADNVRLCAAPLVEGTLAAVVSASAGADLNRVMQEAENALHGKQSQLGGEQQAVQSQTPDLPPCDAPQIDIVVRNRHGIHARPAAKIIETLSPFHARVWIRHDGQFADAKSYNQLIQLQIRQGQPVSFYAEGEEAAPALAALQTLAEQDFGDAPDATTPPQTRLQGIAVAAESVGSAVCFQQVLPAEQGDLRHSVEQALAATREQLAALTALPALPPTFRPLFSAHQLLLEEVSETLLALPAQQDLDAACRAVFDQVAEQYHQVDDPYLRARELDIRDLRDRFSANLRGIAPPLPVVHEDDILCADELYPSALAQLCAAPFGGICLAQGSACSHTTLLANALHIPIALGFGEKLRTIQPGQSLKVNWQKGYIEI